MKKVILTALITVATLFAGSVSEKAPDFSAKTVKGQTYSLAKSAKGVKVINFWATWCVPCMSEMNELAKLHSEFSTKGVEFISISIDDPKSSAKVPGFANARKWPMTILLDPEKSVYAKLKATTTPTTVVIDQNNQIVYRHTGYAKGDEVALKKVIEETLGKGN